MNKQKCFYIYYLSRLNRCNLTENCCEVLASALSSTSSHLTELDLSDNNLKDSGMKLLCVGFGSPHCKLKSLRFVTHVSNLVETIKNGTMYPCKQQQLHLVVGRACGLGLLLSCLQFFLEH